ncbi:MAG: hypothetical protein PHO00_01950 [bacterium]|nr:hypothetical protein [bacterium]
MRNILLYYLLVLIFFIAPLNASASNLDKLKKSLAPSSRAGDVSVSENETICIKSIKNQTSFPGIKWQSDDGFNSRKVRALIVDFRIKTKSKVDCGASKAVLIDTIERVAGIRNISHQPGHTPNYTSGFIFEGAHNFSSYFFYDDSIKFKYAIVFIGNSSNYVMDFFPKGFKPSEELVKRAKEAAGLN